MKMQKHVVLMLNLVNNHQFLKFFQSMVYNSLVDHYCNYIKFERLLKNKYKLYFRVNHATSFIIKPATVRGMKSGKKKKSIFFPEENFCIFR